jgi:hypothetical protein
LSRWPYILDSFFFPKKKLPNSFAIVGLAVGKTSDTKIMLFSDIPIPALTLQYLIPRDGAGAVPYSVGEIEYKLRPKQKGFWTPLISNFPLSIHCGPVFGNAFSASEKHYKKLFEAVIFNEFDNSRMDAIAMETSRLFVDISQINTPMMIQISLILGGWQTVEKMISDLQMELGALTINGAPWVGESLVDWRFPVTSLYDEGEDGLNKREVVDLDEEFRGFVGFYLEQSKGRLSEEMRAEIDAGDVAELDAGEV